MNFDAFLKTSYIVVRGIPGNGTNIANLQLLPMPKKTKFNSKVPPCPDPDKYVLVRGKNGYYWRRKRGTVKPAVLNETLARSAAITSKTNRAAKHMMSLLSVFTQRMALGMATTEAGGAFKRAYLKDGRMDFRFMHEIKFQREEEYPIHKLFTGSVYLQIERGSIQLQVGVGSLNVKAPSVKAEGYQLHAILLYCDPSKERGIKIETDESRIYSFKEKGDLTCQLSLVLPARNRPWMVLLYIGCKMIDKLPAGPRYHAMWVVKAG